MKKLSIFCLTLLFIACSSDSEEPEIINQPDDEVVVEEEEEMEEEVEEEGQTELFSFSVQVKGNYFDESTTGKIYLSNNEGEILAAETLSNNTTSVIELELNGNAEYDITYYIQSDFGNRSQVNIKTFLDISSGQYFLNPEGELNGNGDNFIVTFLNTGFPLEEINPFTRGVLTGPANGGTYELDANLPNYPGSFYAAFLSPNDSSPRYYFGEDIERNSNFEVDYSSLPFVENSINVEYPSGTDFFRVRLNGFYSPIEGVRGLRNVDESEVSTDELVYPDGIFDNYVLDATLVYGTTSQRQYFLKNYGLPESQTFDLPDFDGQILSKEMNDFNMTSNSEYHYSDVFYSFFDRDNNNSWYTFNIYKRGGGNVVFSKQALLDNILSENLSITSDRYRFNYVTLTNNSFFGNDEVKLIQNRMANKIEGRDEFPNGTVIESYRLNN